MPTRIFFGRGGRQKSFTLIELLVVIAIIAILAALTLAAAEAVMGRAARARASSEIAAMSTALESYKTDNGVYPWTNVLNGSTFSSTNDYTQAPNLPGGDYMVSAQLIYQALSGKTNYEDSPNNPPNKSYMPFKPNQLGNASASAGGYSASGSTYVQDPFGYAYGYYASSDAGNPPVSGAGFFDLWTTGNSVTGATNPWICNWMPQ